MTWLHRQGIYNIHSNSALMYMNYIQRCDICDFHPVEHHEALSGALLFLRAEAWVTHTRTHTHIQWYKVSSMYVHVGIVWWVSLSYCHCHWSTVLSWRQWGQDGSMPNLANTPSTLLTSWTNVASKIHIHVDCWVMLELVHVSLSLRKGHVTHSSYSSPEYHTILERQCCIWRYIVL